MKSNKVKDQREEWCIIDEYNTALDVVGVACSMQSIPL